MQVGEGRYIPDARIADPFGRSLGTSFEYLLLGHSEISIGSGGNDAPDKAVTEAVLDARTRVARAMNISLNRVHISVDDD